MTDSLTFEKTAEELRPRAIEKFWEVFPPVWNRIRGNLRLILPEAFNISIEEFHILRHLHRGICSVSQLASVQQISRPAASQAVESLVEKGLVSRHYDVEDRRHIRLALTPAGNELINTIFQKNRRWMMEKMESLSPEQIAAIVEAMEALKAAFVETDA